MDTWGLHIHHDRVCEPMTAPLHERIVDIQKYKSEWEVPIRLQVIRELTEEEVGRLPVAYDQARVALAQAAEGYNRAGEAWVKDREAYYRDIEAWDQAIDAYWQCEPELTAWHATVCVPDCPWNGKTLFPTA